MPDEAKVVVVLGASSIPGDPPTVLLGMTPASWDALEGGNTHHFDLRKIGIPVQIILFRGETHAEITGLMQDGAAAVGGTFEDHRGTGKLPDLGIDEPSKH